MSVHGIIGRIVGVAVGSLALSFPLGAQTNQSTNQAIVSPVAQPEMSETDRFFDQYARAAALMEKGGRQQAAIVMDQLYRSLTTTPWLEIALLKYSEVYEGLNDRTAMDGYDLLRKRLANAPYFQKNERRSRLFGVAMQGAVDRGISRVRIRRIRDALSRYFARYMQYPESLAKLSIFNFIDVEDISDPNNRPFRYIPTGMQLRPTMTYMRYELESIPAEPFYVTSPKLDGTSRVSDSPERYVCLIRAPGKMEPLRVSEDQTLESYFVAAIARRGAVLCGNNRVIVLAVPH